MNTGKIVNQRGVTSSLARCARQTAYRALEVEQDPTPVAMKEFYRRGQWFELMRLAEIRAQLGAENVEQHRTVEWDAAGFTFQGQMDIYEKTTRTVVEVVSLVSPSQDMIGHKIEQCRQYVLLDPEAERGRVDVINPSRLVVDESFPVFVRDGDYAAFSDRVLQVEIALNTGHLPERACAHPREAAGRLCPFKSTCFADWEEPEVDLSSPEAIRAAQDAWEIDQRRQKLKLEMAALDVERGDRLAVLSEMGVEGRARIGGIEVLRSPVKGRTTFKYQAAVKAGVIDEAQVADFVTVGEPSERWRIEKPGTFESVETADDLGEVPF